MGQIKRQTMKFIVPISNEGTISSSLSNKKTVEVYLNPERIDFREKKIQQSSVTKGGFMISYWGEDLPRLSVSGTTGSSGIEGIYILKDVYRNEQIVYKQILESRISTNIENIQNIKTNEQGSSLAGLIETVFNVSNLFNSEDGTGISSTIDKLLSQKNSALQNQKQEILSPSIAAFFTSVEIYFHGERYKGYFENFDFTESTGSLGLFDYNFSFVVLQKYGRRSNFMPWHRNPRDASGEPIPAQIPVERNEDRLTFPFTPPVTTQETITGATTSTILNTQELNLDPNSIPIIRSVRVKS
jgi:hypothetical protein